MPPDAPKLLDRVRATIRVKHYSRKTEKTYVSWIRRFILFHGKRHPAEMGEREIEAFLSYLAVHGKVAAATQNQALNAILFLYRAVLGQQLEESIQAVRAKRPQRVPAVLSQQEARRVIDAMSGTPQLVVKLLYGCGLRLMEGLQLRLKDIDFERGEITVRDGKGAKDRVTMLPTSVTPTLQEHLRRVKTIHEADLAKGRGRVALPYALARKYPNADREWGWPYVFPATGSYQDAQTGEWRRYHLHETTVQKAMKKALGLTGISKLVHCHTFRHNADSGIMPTWVPSSCALARE